MQKRVGLRAHVRNRLIYGLPLVAALFTTCLVNSQAPAPITGNIQPKISVSGKPKFTRPKNKQANSSKLERQRYLLARLFESIALAAKAQMEKNQIDLPTEQLLVVNDFVSFPGANQTFIDYEEYSGFATISSIENYGVMVTVSNEETAVTIIIEYGETFHISLVNNDQTGALILSKSLPFAFRKDEDSVLLVPTCDGFYSVVQVGSKMVTGQYEGCD